MGSWPTQALMFVIDVALRAVGRAGLESIACYLVVQDESNATLRAASNFLLCCGNDELMTYDNNNTPWANVNIHSDMSLQGESTVKTV